MSVIVNDSTDKGSIMESEDRIERAVDIYISAEAVRDMKHKRATEDFNTNKTPAPQHTGSDVVKISVSRAAAVCVLLLCVVLLTAVIVLCVTFTQERRQTLTKITSLTEERDQLLTNNMNLTEEKKHLLTNNMNLTEERNQLLTNNMNLTKEKKQLLTKIMNITEERNKLLTNNMNLTEERDQLKSEKSELQKLFANGWKCHQSSLYFLSSEKKNWSESRRYCTERGADLIIINNSEEQGFVKNMTGGDKFWIGLTDSDVEGRWIWVDGSNVTSGFWATGEPNSYQGKEEDCAVNYSPGWADCPCTNSFKWICEKRILK